MNLKKNTLLSLSLLALGSIITPINADFNDGWIAFTSEDFKTAAKEWTPLAEKGDAKAQTNLGILYFNGKGVLKDYKKAVTWLKEAAVQGEDEAQFILGMLYLEGEGVPQSFKTAKYWVKQAYDANFDGAEDLWENYQLWKY